MTNGRTSRIDRDAIITATLDIGLDTASTVAVARALHVEQPALYRHIGSKAHMLDLAASRALESLDGWQPTGMWEDAARSFQAAIWACLAAHNGVAAYLLTHSAIPAPLQNAAGRLVASADAAGISTRSAILTVDALVHLTCLAIVGTQRLQQSEDAARWLERTIEINDPIVLAAIREVEATDALTLVTEQVDILLRGLTRGAEMDRIAGST